MNVRAILDKLSLPELNASLRLFYAASAQRQMLASIDTSLVLYESELINTANGECRTLPADDGYSKAEQLALAARKLLPASAASPSILLFLPSADFVATRFKLGISGELMLKSALRLQAPTLLPAYEQKLLLALNGNKSEGVALWYPQASADELYQAFAANDLHLAAIMPRGLVAERLDQTSSTRFVLDEDERYLSLLELDQGALASCQSMQRSELTDAAFNHQWQAELARLAGQEQLTLDRSFWTSLRTLLPARPAYCFYPAGAVGAGKKLLAHKQKRAAAFSVAALFLLFALPFVSNWVQITWLNRQMDELQQLSVAARASQAAVYDMEDTWGVVAEYPQQDVSQILLSLNQLIEGALSSFSLNKGLIDITGFSQDTALLVEQLAELELFYDVGQSRSSSSGNNASLGDRFGIRMNVSGVDFPAYEEKFPATAEQ